MIGNHGRVDAVAFEQLARHPGVLAGDNVCAFQNIAGAGGQVPHIPDGGRDDVQSGLQGTAVTDTFTWRSTVASLPAVAHIVRNRMHR